MHLLPRVKSAWASWGIVESTLLGLRAAQALEVDHVVLLTGQDYPLVAAPEIDSFSDEHRGLSFARTSPLPYPLYGPDGGWSRVRHWHYPAMGRRFRIPITHRPPSGIQIYRGSQLFMLTRRAVRTVVDFVDARPDVVRFYRHSWIPDELFVQTVLRHTVADDEIVDESLWFIQWPGGSHPRILTMHDAPDLRRDRHLPSEVSGYGRRKLFARKFDLTVDSHVLDEIDSWDR